MRSKHILLWIIAGVLLFSCKKEKTTTVPPPEKPVLLKDIVVPGLPSPYYHFEYDNAGSVTHASFASGLRLYNLVYANSKISEIMNNTAVNKDRLQYIYNDAGQVDVIKYVNEAGTVFRRCYLTYNGDQLRLLEWERKVDAGFAMERTMAFIYQADGNLLEITDHLYPIPGQQEGTRVSRFEEYDTKLNTDGFSLIHDNTDHLLLLPSVRLQKNNPGRLIFSGIGQGYTIEYNYTYNAQNAPITKTGNAVFTSGPNTGQRWQTNALFSYYP